MLNWLGVSDRQQRYSRDCVLSFDVAFSRVHLGQAVKVLVDTDGGGTHVDDAYIFHTQSLQFLRSAGHKLHERGLGPLIGGET